MQTGKLWGRVGFVAGLFSAVLAYLWPSGFGNACLLCPHIDLAFARTLD